MLLVGVVGVVLFWAVLAFLAPVSVWGPVSSLGSCSRLRRTPSRR